MKNLLHIFNISKSPLATAVHALATEIMPVSRINVNSDIIQIKSICEIPKIPKNFNKNFDQVTNERALYVWQNHSKNNSVCLLWSGGIDSTLALVALLKTAPAQGMINVYCNVNSIFENTVFYTFLLKQKNIRLCNSSLLPADEQFEIITGDLGDQIFGSELLYRVNHMFGFDQLGRAFEQVIPKLFSARCGDQMGAQLYDRYLPIVKNSPIPIVTAFDYIWWWNFTQKWQGVKFRKQCFMASEHRSIHFFDNTDYQLWSLFFHDKKMGQKIETYKMPAKEFIYTFDKNESYLQNKKKLGSPYGNKVFYFGFFEDGTRITTWTECLKILDELAIIG